ncbi:MAG: ParA family protein [Candidatus Caenarcaniphilales bacterium]|nr:ParA family protein [Candidatus Caenarcaniphilales bacterium]
MTITVCLASHKGGVGKTTSAVNLAVSAAASNKKVLLVDIDPQANATYSLAAKPAEGEYTICDLLTRRPVETSEVIHRQVRENLDVIPSKLQLATVERELFSIAFGENKLMKALSKVADDYDLIVIDTPPNLGQLTINGLFSSNMVIIPVAPSAYALEGLSDIIDVINDLNQVNTNTSIKWKILKTMVDARNRSTNEIVGELLNPYGQRIFKTEVPRSEAANQAPFEGKSISDFDNKSPAAEAYVNLSDEIFASGSSSLSVNSVKSLKTNKPAKV